MTNPTRGLGLSLLLFLGAAGCLLETGDDLELTEEGLALGNRALYDFLVQDVCVVRGRVRAIDPRFCARAGGRTRDLMVNEYLPYHKFDRPGTQVSDSIPRRNYEGRLRYLRTLDNAFDWDGRRFLSSALEMSWSAADGRYVDGHNTDEADGEVVSIVGTRDSFGATLWRRGRRGGDADAWALFERSAVGAREEYRSDPICAPRISEEPQDWGPRDFPGCDGEGTSHTRWRRQRVAYSTGAVLDSIVIDHYGGSRREIGYSGLERFYYTREYGLTRWESYQTEDWPYWVPDVRRPDRDALERAWDTHLASSNRACPRIAPTLGALRVYGCREWMRIVPATPGGDPPYLWPTIPDFTMGNLVFNGDFGLRNATGWRARRAPVLSWRMDQEPFQVGRFQHVNNHTVMACQRACANAGIWTVVPRVRGLLNAGSPVAFGARVWGASPVRMVVEQLDDDGRLLRKKELVIRPNRQPRWYEGTFVAHGRVARLRVSFAFIGQNGAAVRIDDVFVARKR